MEPVLLTLFAILLFAGAYRHGKQQGSRLGFAAGRRRRRRF